MEDLGIGGKDSRRINGAGRRGVGGGREGKGGIEVPS
jgi:hypothetical protein